ncbi:MAG: helix-turn-helix transcriptional regulator [Phycisphaerales bacterium]|nr:helix-turn-helix transcriptional regulator [Phycisphaerales bacterium]
MLEADFVKVAKALADPTRYRMLQELRRAGELTCSCMCKCFPLSQPTISHHIKTLEEAGLISTRKDGPYHVLTVNETLLAAFTKDLSEPGPEARPPESGVPVKRKIRRRKTLL